MASLWLLALFPFFDFCLGNGHGHGSIDMVSPLAHRARLPSMMMDEMDGASLRSLRGSPTGTADSFLQSHQHNPEEELNLIPLPARVTRTAGLLRLHTDNAWHIVAPTQDLHDAVWSHVLARAGKQSENSTTKTIRLSFSDISDKDSDENPESYELVVSDTGVDIVSSTEHGLFNGVMTLRQLLHKEQEQDGWTVPHVQIQDAPTFAWRGLMLDVSRHFFGPDKVRKLLDTMALYKMNHLHLHLTDDQGWRLQVEKFPDLTEVGASRKSTQRDMDASNQDGKPHGGYFSKQDLTDLVLYAQKLFIDIMPEIDLPGHAQAAIAAYPEFGNVDIEGWQEPEVSCTFGVGPYTFAPSTKVISFVETILDEAMDVMPSNFVHLGGDEVSTTQWGVSTNAQQFMQQQSIPHVGRIQGWFNTKLEAHVADKGRKVVLWDEALTKRGAPKGSVIMVWSPGNAEAVAKQAAREGHDVILAPWGYTYFDQAQAHAGEPKGQPGVVELSHTYSMPISNFGSPKPMGEAAPVEPNAKSYKDALLGEEVVPAAILGGQGQLWSEFFPDWERVEYMAWPRGLALAEVLWTGAARPSFADFRRRLGPRLEELADLGVGFRDPDKHA